MSTKEGGHVATRLTIAIMDSLDMVDMSVSVYAAQWTQASTFSLVLQRMEVMAYGFSCLEEILMK